MNKMSMFGNYTGQTDRKGLPDGIGKMVWNTNGDVYEGEWRKGVQHGYGLMYYHTYQTKYHGGFAMGKKHG